MALKPLILRIILLCFLPAYAVAFQDFPSTFEVKQVSCPVGSKHCMSLTSADAMLGSLESAPDKSNLFYFFDAQHNRQLSIRHLNTRMNVLNCGMNCPIFQDFDIYEKNNHLVAKLELSYDVMQGSFNTLRLYTKDHRYLLLSGTHTTSTGTTSIIYDGLNPDLKLASIIRPFFTRSLDSKITLLDKSSLFFSVDPYVFASTLALYCNTTLFYEKPRVSPGQTISTETLNRLRKNLQALAESRGILLEMNEYMNTHTVKAAGNILIQRYEQTYGDFWDDESLFTKDKKLQQLFDIGFDLILSQTLSPTEEKAMFQFLVSQLYLNQ